MVEISSYDFDFAIFSIELLFYITINYRNIVLYIIFIGFVSLYNKVNNISLVFFILYNYILYLISDLIMSFKFYI